MWRTVNSVEQQIVDGVAQNGWYSVTYVPAPGDPEEWFTYTVGLTKTAGWPEIIVFGLDRDRSFQMLHDTLHECWGRSAHPYDGMELVEVLKGRPARLREVNGLTAPYFAMAEWYAQHSGTPSLPERLQLMWPDENGRFPDDAECDARVRELQTPRRAQ
jgi:hypothetical protein